ncbi:MAG: 4-hydroxy-tetrahydrodipicolinate synthase [Candidatus Gracilibacteria bacterium]|nr:4-hydroxy-tetrahydrodipicolinate synthase [Candidatus Gracilibacteria bacterium]MDQ7023345.1 4-hydroxy-tetrahydrodipicolinate synthase [Candidatus Gracilibacteria bacterium]
MKGLWTALITPFKKGNGIDSEIDYVALEKLLNMQIEGGVDGVLLLGTTAENPTLTKEEGLKIVKFSINILKGKTKIMVNVGTYSTKSSIENIENFDKVKGIDIYLVVNPYYNKPTQTGLKMHFITCAKGTSRNIVLYNIKGRTGVNLETSTLLEIVGECDNVIGVKEASGNMEQMLEVVNKTSDDFLVFSGDDSLTYELVKNGGSGVISVASNIFPKMMKEFIDSCFEDNSKAEILNNKYSELFDKLFIQANPLPSKTYLATKGIIEEEFRLPMCRMDNNERIEFLDFMKNNY